MGSDRCALASTTGKQDVLAVNVGGALTLLSRDDGANFAVSRVAIVTVAQMRRAHTPRIGMLSTAASKAALKTRR